MKIESAFYSIDTFGEKNSINAVIDGILWSIPLDSSNADYQEIMRLVEAGELVIEPQDV